MKITKYLHACLLVEHEDRVAIIDPGVFSWNENTLDIDSLEKLDRIIITHPHPDHMSIDFVQALIQKFPEAHIVGNKAVQTKLMDAGVSTTMRDSTGCSVMFNAAHPSIDSLAGNDSTPPNSGVHFQKILTHPGDSLEIQETMPVLAMPFVAPWGDVMSAIDKAIALKPKYVVPIHDWFFSDRAQAWLYSMIEARLKEHNITLTVLKTGDTTQFDA